jgi:hypothetical protein
VVAGGVFSVALPANATSTTPEHGCYAQYWNTAFEGDCVGTDANVIVQLRADCSYESDYVGPNVYINKGSTVKPFDSDECTFTVYEAWPLVSLR